jgi:hypothetical protein
MDGEVVLQCFGSAFAVDMECRWNLDLLSIADTSTVSCREIFDFVVQVDISWWWESISPDARPDLDWELREKREGVQIFAKLNE